MKIEEMHKKLALIILSTATLGISIMIGIKPVLSQTECSCPDCLPPNPCDNNPLLPGCPLCIENPNWCEPLPL